MQMNLIRNFSHLNDLWGVGTILHVHSIPKLVNKLLVVQCNYKKNHNLM